MLRIDYDTRVTVWTFASESFIQYIERKAHCLQSIITPVLFWILLRVRMLVCDPIRGCGVEDGTFGFAECGAKERILSSDHRISAGTVNQPD